MSYHNCFSLLRFALTALTLCLAGTVNAQDSEAGASSALDEIVVTAQRREQRMQDVPISIAAIQEEQLQDQHILEARDLANKIPNLRVADTAQGRFPIYIIRGVGGGSSPSVAVSVSVDEVVNSGGVMNSGQIYDVERVEVLRGPQGTLYGRNSTGGAINFVTKKPTGEKETSLQVGFGEYSTYETAGVFNRQLSDNVNGRFAWQSRNRTEGWQTNFHTGEKHGEIEKLSGRAMFDWQASDDVSVLFNVHYYRDRSDYSGSVTLGNALGFDPYDRPEAYLDDDLDPQKYVGFATEADGADNCNTTGTACRPWGVKPIVDQNAYGGYARIEWALSDSIDLMSLTAFEHVDSYRIQDEDGSPVFELDGLWENEIDQFTQEIHLAGGSERFRWIAGIFYSNEDNFTSYSADMSDSMPLLFGLPSIFWSSGSWVDSSSAAVFADVEFDLAEDWTVIVGARYTDEEKSTRGGGMRTIGDLRSDPTIQAFYCAPGADPFLCDAFDDGGMLSGNINGDPTDPDIVNGDFSNSATSGRVVLQWRPTDTITTYLSASRGFRSGGFAQYIFFEPREIAPYGPEQVDALEWGLKMTLAEGKIGANVALFEYDYQDKQIQTDIWDPIISGVFALANVAESEIEGGELELYFRPIDGLEIMLSGSKQESRTLNYEFFDSDLSLQTGPICDGNGENQGSGTFFCKFFGTADGAVDRIRPYQRMAAISYTFGVGNGYEMKAAYDYSSLSAENKPPGSNDRAPGFSYSGAILRLTAPDEKWIAELWGRNITDQRSIASGGTNVTMDVFFPQIAPREYGARFSYNFH